jgi:outer membrane lipopolysaccharide assembly protein LptE/RlpB
LTIGNDARVREFRLRLELEFKVLEGAGAEQQEEQQIRLKTQFLKQQRDLRFDADRVLATSREAEFLQEDMSGTLVHQFMQRLGQLDPLN